MAGNAQAVIDLDRKRMQAMAKKDVATLQSVLADDLIYTHSSARLDTKKSLIDNMVSGSTVYTSVEPFDVTLIWQVPVSTTVSPRSCALTSDGSTLV